MVAPKNQLKDGKKKAAAIAAGPSDKLQAADETSQQADQFESEITDLKVKYDQYFLGLERFEPVKERDALKARLVKFKQGFIRNTGVRFRVQAQYQKFLSYERMWMRIAKEIEDGTYSRDLFKAKMRGAKRKGKEEKKKKGEAFDLSAEANDLGGGDVPEPKTDPHLSIPPELLNDPPLVVPRPHSSEEPPLIVPHAAKPPPPPPGMAAKSGSMPAIESQRPASSSKPPPPPPADAMASGSRPASAAGSKPPPPPPGAQASRISGPQPVVAPASAKTSGPQPLVVPTAAKATGPLPVVAPARATSNPGSKAPPPPPGTTGRVASVPPPPPASSATSPGSRPPPPPPGASGVRPPPSGSVGLGEDKMKAIVSAYIAAKRQCKESTEGITYESVSKSINSQVPELMKQHNAKAVDFKVVIKNGKATLKAVPKV